ncbi:MAG: retropepsin-like aspartic protease [Terriglobia bacterium]
MLSVGRKSVRLHAKLDTGADYCIFAREHGEELGLIIIEDGQLTSFSTANSEFRAYGHEVTLTCFEWQFESMVYFAEMPEIRRNLLGRQGWLQQFRVALVDYDSVLHLSHYNKSF